MSKHGGSESSGLVAPVGMGELVKLDGSTMFEPPEVTEARRQAAKRQERARQFERRRLALAVLPELTNFTTQMGKSDADLAEANVWAKNAVTLALTYADELMAQTGNEVA